MVAVRRSVFFVVCLLLSVGVSWSAFAGEALKRRYIVTVRAGETDVDGVARSLTATHGGRLLAVWKHAIKGFWVEMPRAGAIRLSTDKRVAAVEEDAELAPSDDLVRPTGRAAAIAAGIPEIAPICPDDEDPPVTPKFDPDPLWHLTRLSHRKVVPGLSPCKSADDITGRRNPGETIQDYFQFPLGNKGAGVKVYLVDLGVTTTHPELSEVHIEAGYNAASIPKDTRFTDAPEPYEHDESLSVNPCPATNPIGSTHGTATASFIVGKNLGVAPGVTLVSVMASSCETVATPTVGLLIGALDWVKQDMQGAQQPAVVSLSTFRKTGDVIEYIGTANGDVSETRPERCRDNNPGDCAMGRPLGTLETVLQQIVTAGVPIVVSANNQNSDACFTTPARLARRGGRPGANVITVGGIDRRDRRWDTVTEPGVTKGSNFGQCVDIWAPAAEMAVATVGTNQPYGHTEIRSGTSYSAPMVAAIVARLMAEDSGLYEDPATTVEKVWTRLKENASEFTASNRGMASPDRLAYVGGVTFVQQPRSVVLTAGQTTGTLSVDIFERAGVSYKYQWYRGENEIDGATSSSVTAGPSSEKYWVRVQQVATAGSPRIYADSNRVTVESSNCTVPQIGTQPVTQWVVRNAGQSASATLTATVTASGNVTYQWQRLDPPIPPAAPDGHDGATPREVNVGPATSVPTSLNLAISPAPDENLEGRVVNPDRAVTTYRLAITNACGTKVFSDTAQVRVCTRPAPPVVTAPVQDGHFSGVNALTAEGQDSDTKILWYYAPPGTGTPAESAFSPFIIDRESGAPPLSTVPSRSPLPWMIFEKFTMQPPKPGWYAARQVNACGESGLSNFVQVLSVCRTYVKKVHRLNDNPVIGDPIPFTPGEAYKLTVEQATDSTLVPYLRYAWSERPGVSESSITTDPITTARTITVQVTDVRSGCVRDVAFVFQNPCTLQLEGKGPGDNDFISAPTVEAKTYTVNRDESVTLSVRATGARGTARYQWIVDNQPRSENGSSISIPVDRRMDVQVRVTDDACTRTMTFRLAVRDCDYEVYAGRCQLVIAPQVNVKTNARITLSARIGDDKGQELPGTENSTYRWEKVTSSGSQLLHEGTGTAGKSFTHTVTDLESHAIKLTVIHQGCPKDKTIPVTITGISPSVYTPSCKKRRVARHSGEAITHLNFSPGESVDLRPEEIVDGATYEWHREVYGSGEDEVIAEGTLIEIVMTSPARYWFIETNGPERNVSDPLETSSDGGQSRSVEVDPLFQSIPGGNTAFITARLIADHIADEVLTYEWRRGAIYDTSRPIIGTQSTLVLPDLPDDSVFWCRINQYVRNASQELVLVDSFDSPFASIVVNCTNTVGGLVAANPPFVAAGYPSYVAAAPRGKLLTMEWYRILDDGITRVPITSGQVAGVNVYPTTAVTRIGASATDVCGTSGDLTPATVYLCVPTITQQPQSVIIRGGTAATLTAAATPAIAGQPVAQTWHDPGDQYHLQSLGSGASFTTPVLAPGETRSFLSAFEATCVSGVEYTLESEVAVVQACANPVLESHTPTLWSTNPGSPVGISIYATGTDLTYQWYRGNSGDTSNLLQGKTERELMVYPTTTTSYWWRSMPPSA